MGSHAIPLVGVFPEGEPNTILHRIVRTSPTGLPKAGAGETGTQPYSVCNKCNRQCEAMPSRSFCKFNPLNPADFFVLRPLQDAPISDYSTLKSKILNLTSQAAIRPYILPNSISDLIHFAFDRGRFVRILLYGRTCPSNQE